MGVCQSTQVEEVHVMLSELQTGDVLLSKEPILSSPGACFMRSCLCWQAHHIGLVVNPADFPAESHLRRRHPEMEQGSMYVFHALVTGMKVWDLERYIRRIHNACVLPGEAWVRQLRASTETPSDFRPQLIAELDAAFEELHSRPYEKNQLSTLHAFCDCAEVCGLCQAKQDTSSIFCSELVAEVLQRGKVLSTDRPSSEFTPMDFLRSDGRSVEQAKLQSCLELGRLRRIEVT
ncbi:unnamed protein product [Symbiodinium sp. CCMP2592]|nr:unnamed protein product [Symbiodinium sp. CCMP2592]